MPHEAFEPPPADFLASAADDVSLRRYGFPVGRWRDRWYRGITGRVLQPTFRDMQHKRHLLRTQRYPGEETATVWSGAVIYAPKNTTFNAVEAIWNVPNSRSPAEAENAKWYTASSWIGIDGDGDSTDILQAGVDCDVFVLGGEDQARLATVWYQWVPEGSVWLANLHVSPGDELDCQIVVNENSNTAATIYLQNDTSGDALSFKVSAPEGTKLKGNCVEWIVERLRFDQHHKPILADYAPVSFKDIAACTVDGDVVQLNTPRVASDCVDMIEMKDENGKTISKGRALGANIVLCEYTGPFAARERSAVAAK